MHVCCHRWQFSFSCTGHESVRVILQLSFTSHNIYVNINPVFPQTADQLPYQKISSKWRTDSTSAFFFQALTTIMPNPFFFFVAFLVVSMEFRRSFTVELDPSCRIKSNSALSSKREVVIQVLNVFCNLGHIIYDKFIQNENLQALNLTRSPPPLIVP